MTPQAIVKASKQAASALAGGSALWPVPGTGGLTAAGVYAVCGVTNGGMRDYQVIRDTRGRLTKIRIGTVGGSIGTIATFWIARKPDAPTGHYDGLKQRV